jgi:hypothetical protein
MFETYESARLEAIPGYDSPSVATWSSVFTRIHTPWIHVVYAVLDADEITASRVIFLLNPSQLLELKESKEVEIIEVNLVSPAYLSGAGRWAMEELEAIWEADEPEIGHKQVAQIFIVPGKRYVYSALDTNENKLLNPRSLFKAKN